MKRFLTIIFVIFSFLFCNKIYAKNVSLYGDNSFEKEFSNLPYIITNYNVDIKVNKNNVLNITETINVLFNQQRHGIIRSIPISNTIKRYDKDEEHIAQISNINVNNKFTTSSTFGGLEIKIGDKNEYVFGNQEYIINYDYNIITDYSNLFDELYFNIIGSDWDTVINNITFTIKMPDNFDYDKIGFSHGVTGSVGYNAIDYRVNNNIITGKYNDYLRKQEAITIRIELPDGYFQNVSIKYNYFNYVALIIPFLFVVIGFIIWYKYGKDDKVIETVEFYPPYNLNSLEIGNLYKGSCNSTDVTSLLIYLANKGYIKIEEDDKVSLFNNVQYKIVKLKEYDGNDKNEKTFLDGLFAGKHSFKKDDKDGKYKVTIEDFNTVKIKDLKYKFHKYLERIINNVESSNRKKPIIKDKYYWPRLILSFMIFAILISMIYAPLKDFNYINISTLITIFSKLWLYMLQFIIIVFIVLFGNTTKANLAIIIFILTFITIIIFASSMNIIKLSKLYTASCIISYISIFILLVIYYFMPKRTKYGTEALGKILGFKNYLETVEKEKLEMLINENPSYFYDILPYAYVLGITDIWIKKFENIALKEPDWYSGISDFHYNIFTDNIKHTMNSAQRTFKTVAPSQSSGSSRGSNSFGGGGSSGGGFSGGGFGGGGGSSW